MWALRGKCGCLSEGAAGSLGGQRLSLGWAVPASSEQQEGPTGILRCLFTDSLLPQEAQKNPWPEKNQFGFQGQPEPAAPTSLGWGGGSPWGGGLGSMRHGGSHTQQKGSGCLEAKPQRRRPRLWL